MKNNPASTAMRFLSLGAALAAAALQTCAMLFAHETESNYYIPGSLLPLFACLCAILSGVLGILSVFTSPKRPADKSPIRDSVLHSLPAMVGCIASALCLFFTDPSATGILVALFLLGAALYGYFCTIPKFPLLGSTAVLGCALLNAYYYFDVSVEMNAPVKVLLQTALLFAMIYYTCELRFLLGRGKPRLFPVFAYATIAASSLCAVSLPVAFLCGIIQKPIYAMGAVTLLGISLTAALRLFYFYKEENVDPVPHTTDTKEDSAE